jgi:hypothetical protein
MYKFCENKHFSAFSYNLDDPTYVAEKKGKTQFSEISLPGNFSFFPSRQNSLSMDLIELESKSDSLSMDLIELESKSESKSTCQHPFPGNFSFFPSRQNSLTTTTLKSKNKSRCWCSGNTCQQKYLRQSKYPRIIEPSSKLTKYGFNKKVQIRIPKELQSHIGYGSCKHSYHALVTFITYIQLKSEFKVKKELHQTFRTPSRKKIERTRRVIEGFGLPNDFYVNIWAPTFQGRFTVACGGIRHIQKCMRSFFASSELELLNHIQEVEKQTTDDLISECSIFISGEQSVENHIQEMEKQDVDDLKKECLHMQKILSDHTITNVRKMSLCTGILYELIKNPIKKI